MKRLKTCMILAGILLLCIQVNAFGFGKGKFEDELAKEAAVIKFMKETERGGYGVISTSDLEKLIKSGEDVLIIDTMPYESSYKKNHIPGAEQFLFPIPDMNEWNNAETAGKTIEDFEKLLGPDKNRKVVVYCGFVKCTRSHNGAAWAKKLGYKNVFRQPGGIYGWKGADYNVEKSE